MIHEKVILTDCDGVLVDWMYSFQRWMIRHGYKVDIENKNDYRINKRFDIGLVESKRLIRMFNESATIRRIPPLRDAIKYVKKLHEEHGYVFHVITSQTDDEFAQHLRVKNLTELFGKTVFEKFIFLPCGADKDQELFRYKGSLCWWIEDKPENADVGHKMELDSILVSHEYNKGYQGPAKVVQNWKEIYKLISGL